MTQSNTQKKYSPQDVLKLKAPTKGFLCPIDANTAGIQFLNFKIRDADTQKIIFETSLDSQPEVEITPGMDLDQLRQIKYTFDKSFLTSQRIGTTVVFSVGDKPVKNFRMVERHYFKNKLIKSFDFNFHFCIPNSTNSWECIYEMPKLDKKQIDDMMNSPYETKSDSFYFINDGEMIMHNKAEYEYVDTDKQK